MAEAKQGDTVRVHYTGRLNNGEVFDSSREREPLEFTLGAGQMIPGFEQAVAGMAVGETRSVTLEPSQAYGQHQAEMVLRVNRSDIPDDLNLEVGMMVQAAQANNEVVVMTVTELNDETVTLDANHPLAGQELMFEIELMEIGEK